MVDFVICLESSEEDIEEMRQIATRDPASAKGNLFAINHTAYTPLLAQPITISVETKRPGEDWDTAQVQLGIWASAHLTRLEQLMRLAGNNQRLPVLPLIVIQGHEWNFLAATREGFGKTVGCGGPQRTLD